AERAHAGPDRLHPATGTVGHPRERPRRVREGTPPVHEPGRVPSRLAGRRTGNPATLDIGRALEPPGHPVARVRVPARRKPPGRLATGQDLCGPPRLSTQRPGTCLRAPGGDAVNGRDGSIGRIRTGLLRPATTPCRATRARC